MTDLPTDDTRETPPTLPEPTRLTLLTMTAAQRVYQIEREFEAVASHDGLMQARYSLAVALNRVEREVEAQASLVTEQQAKLSEQAATIAELKRKLSVAERE